MIVFAASGVEASRRRPWLRRRLRRGECLDIVKRRIRPPVAAKSDPAGGLAGPYAHLARPL